ncbi:DUF4832 domain-containing protein [Candidatus Poribacteria bacterium]
MSGKSQFIRSGLSVVDYKGDNWELFPNPERGFYHYAATYSSNYKPLNEYGSMEDPLNTDMDVEFRRGRNITLIQRYFYLEDFVERPISRWYLGAMKDDFRILRTAGLKAIVRFAYTDKFPLAYPYGDAKPDYVLTHLDQLEPILQENIDVIAIVQAGFIGMWGEWFWTDHFIDNPDDPYNVTQDDYAIRGRVLARILAALPSSRKVQVRKLSDKLQIIGHPRRMIEEEDFERIGYHNDYFLGDDTDSNTFASPTWGVGPGSAYANDIAYLEEDTKIVPMGGETPDENNCLSRSDCPTALDELKQFHWSFLNIDRYKLSSGDPGFLEQWDEQCCLKEVQRRLGYRLILVRGIFANQVKPGGAFGITIQLYNDGWAAPFNPRDVRLVLRNQITSKIWGVTLPDDPRTWLPSGDLPALYSSLDHMILAPQNIPTGDYDMFLHLPDPEESLSRRPEYAIRLANPDTWEANTGYNDLMHKITVTDTPDRQRYASHLLVLSPE